MCRGHMLLLALPTFLSYQDYHMLLLFLSTRITTSMSSLQAASRMSAHLKPEPGSDLAPVSSAVSATPEESTQQVRLKFRRIRGVWFAWRVCRTFCGCKLVIQRTELSGRGETLLSACGGGGTACGTHAKQQMSTDFVCVLSPRSGVEDSERGGGVRE